MKLVQLQSRIPTMRLAWSRILMTLTPMHSVTVVRTMTRKPLPFICVQDVTTLIIDGLSQEILLLAAIMIR